MKTLSLKKYEDRRLREGHLWIYSNEVDTAKTPLKTLEAGEQVIIEDVTGKKLGIATVSPNSLICARLVSRDVKHPLDKSLIVYKLNQALSLRERFYDEPYYRLVYGDSDGLCGLVVDRFGDYCVVQTTTVGMERLKDDIVQALVKVLNPTGILFKNDSKARALEGLESYIEVAYGDVPKLLPLVENGVKFVAPAHEGQKTGWFYDHRESRAQLQRVVKGKRVLDVFSYAGSWGIQAAAFGAADVTCIDASAFNGLEDKVHTLQGDAFQMLTELKQQGEQFDVIVLDPPAFMQKRKDHANGLQAYRRINELAMRLLVKDGILVSGSCSMHLKTEELVDVIRGASRHLDKTAQVVFIGGQGADHPVHPAIPETSYLKCVMARVLGA